MNDSLLSSQLGSFTFGQAQNCIENDQITICIVKMQCLIIYVIEDTIQKCGGQFHNDDAEGDEADCLSRSGKCSRRVDCDQNENLPPVSNTIHLFSVHPCHYS